MSGHIKTETRFKTISSSAVEYLNNEWEFDLEIFHG